MDLSVANSNAPTKLVSMMSRYSSGKSKPLTIDCKTVLGKGAYGQVYKGMLQTDQRKKAVAIKQMSYSPHSTNGIPHAALREIATTSQLVDSEHIISLLDHRDMSTDQPNTTKMVLVYELMSCDLTKFLKDFSNEHGRSQRLPMDLIKKWYRHLMSGVEEMHSNRITHRDLKPDNILIDSRTMDLKISDLGLAHAHGFEGSRTPEVVTLWYRAPEIVMRLPYGSASDIWSIGLIMYEIIKMRPMLVGDVEIELLRNILKLTGKPNDSYLSRFNISSWECFVKQEDLPLKNRIAERLKGEDAILIDLFERLLKFEADDRLTAYEALQHPFFMPGFVWRISKTSDSPAISENSMDTESRSSAEEVRDEDFDDDDDEEDVEYEEEQQDIKEEDDEEEEDQDEDNDDEDEEDEDEDDVSILNVHHPYLPSFPSRQQKRRRTVGPCEVSRMDMDISPAWPPLTEVDENVEDPGWTDDSSSASGENFQRSQVVLVEDPDTNRLVLRQSSYRPEEISAIVDEFSARNPEASRLWNEPQVDRGRNEGRKDEGKSRRSLPCVSVWTDMPSSRGFHRG